MKFHVVKSDIINIPADAVVLPANERLKEGTGTSKAIFEAAGREELTKACTKIGHCDMGCAVPTSAYNLNSKYIIHAVVPRWKDGNSGEYDFLSAAYLSALNIADIMHCESIAFPLLSSGFNGFDKELAVQIAKESIEHFSGTFLKQVILVVYGDRMEEFMKSKGFTVMVIPDEIRAAKRKDKHKSNAEKLKNDSKEVAQNFMEDLVSKGIEWFQNKENRELVFHYGALIAQSVLNAKILKR